MIVTSKGKRPVWTKWNSRKLTSHSSYPTGDSSSALESTSARGLLALHLAPAWPDSLTLSQPPSGIVISNKNFRPPTRGLILKLIFIS
eukprot:g71449.t1